MDGVEFRTIREQLNLNRNQFARLLGYTGNSTNNVTQIKRYETGDRQIPLYIARLAWLIARLDTYRLAPEQGLKIGKDQFGQIAWPYWPGYVFDSEPDDAGGKEKE